MGGNAVIGLDFGWFSGIKPCHGDDDRNVAGVIVICDKINGIKVISNLECPSLGLGIALVKDTGGCKVRKSWLECKSYWTMSLFEIS